MGYYSQGPCIIDNIKKEPTNGNYYLLNTYYVLITVLQIYYNFQRWI